MSVASNYRHYSSCIMSLSVRSTGLSIESPMRRNSTKCLTSSSGQPRLDVLLDRKGRKGKDATIVAGFTLPDDTTLFQQFHQLVDITLVNAAGIHPIVFHKNVFMDKCVSPLIHPDTVWPAASEFAKIDNKAFKLLKANLPGPFTFILPASPGLAKAFKGRHEVGVRVPANDIARRIAEVLGNPLLSATADWEGAEEEELMRAEDVSLHFEDVADAFVGLRRAGVCLLRMVCHLHHHHRNRLYKTIQPKHRQTIIRLYCCRAVSQSIQSMR